MLKKKTVSDLRFAVLAPGAARALSSDEFERVYELWHRSWNDTFAELGVGHVLTSDDFLAREIGCVFAGSRPVGMVLFYFFDLERRSHREHSYFASYPEHIVAEYRRLGHARVMAAGYMTVDNEWRRSETDVPLSEVLVGLTAQRFLDSDASAMISYLRNGKRANEMFYRHGGIPMLKGAIAHNVEVDFAFISRQSAKDSESPGVAHAVHALYEGWLFTQRRRAEQAA